MIIDEYKYDISKFAYFIKGLQRINKRCSFLNKLLMKISLKTLSLIWFPLITKCLAHRPHIAKYLLSTLFSIHTLSTSGHPSTSSLFNFLPPSRPTMIPLRPDTSPFLIILQHLTRWVSRPFPPASSSWDRTLAVILVIQCLKLIECVPHYWLCFITILTRWVRGFWWSIRHRRGGTA